MKNIRFFMKSLLLSLCLVLPFSTIQAGEAFDHVGIISSVGYYVFTVKGKEYRVADEVEVDSVDEQREEFSDLRAGDWIFFSGEILQGDAHYVDKISYREQFES